jgi:hypothetical protein
MFQKAWRWLISPAPMAGFIRFMVCAVLVWALLLGVATVMGQPIVSAWHPWFLPAIFFPALCVAWIFSAAALRWRGRLDRRVADMLAATLVAVWLTLVGLVLGWHHAKEATEEIFNGWTASVIFWAFVGLMVAVVSLNRAADEDYRTRALILFQNQEGAHIQHIIDTLCGTVGHYQQSVRRDIEIRDHVADRSGGPGWFLMEQESTTILRAYIQDAETVFESAVTFTNTTAPPPGHRPARIVRAACVQSDGTPSDTNIIALPDGFRVEYKTRFITRDATCELTVHREYWVREGEENFYELGRFAQAATVRIRNLCPNRDPVVIDRRLPAPAGQISLQRDEGWKTIASRQDGKPDEVIHDFGLTV